MRVDLFQLLSERSIIHPSQIDSVTWNADELVVGLHGYRWWERPYFARETVGTVRLIFGGLMEGSIRTDEFAFHDDEALEDFELKSAAEVGWAQSSDWSIFCSGPITNPLKIFVRLHDFLSEQDSFRTPADFLNQANNLSAFVSMTQSSGFMLGRGPDCVRSLLCDELEGQGVPHNVVRTTADTSANFVVRFGLSAFLCVSAEAEFEPPS